MENWKFLKVKNPLKSFYAITTKSKKNKHVTDRRTQQKCNFLPSYNLILNLNIWENWKFHKV